ncbi:alanine dehydrogenase [uncultured Corynebacterium sp.]|uniref:alanine dehydrogenase n=1 Tax=uncultured Corynebacterium sp. TaxID=159447 RepID=UPI0025FFCD1A|nr:alanine dehydrogenase [uncultured Corynebacterium sp.]
MRIGVPAEIMNNEKRVALTPHGVSTLVGDGHEVLIQSGAGVGASFDDARYESCGARIVPTAADAWAADLVLKVKEPLEEEFGFLRGDQTLFTYLHLAAAPELTRRLMEAGTTAIAYETVTDSRGGLPLLAPMSQVAGRLAVIEGAHHLVRSRGVLLSGVPGTPAARVVVVGGGQVGASAVAMAFGLRAEVTVIDLDPAVLQRFDDQYSGGVRTVVSNPAALEVELLDADLVIGAVLVPGAAAPKLVREDTVSRMKPGAVLVDVAIDQGGCFENSHKTTHDEPTFKVHDTTFYCVANMPGAVSNTAARALGAATLPFVRALAGAADAAGDATAIDAAFDRYPGLRGGLMTRGGELLSEPVREALSL